MWWGISSRTITQITGWIFIFFGIAGVFLPVLQGIIFLGIGGYLLSAHSPFFARMVTKARGRFKTLDAVLKRVEEKQKKK